MAQNNTFMYHTSGMQNGEALTIPLVVLEDHHEDIPNRFRLIFIKTGTGLVQIGQKQLHFMAPSVLCLPTNSPPLTLIASQAIKTQELVFHPLFINPDYGQVDPELLWIQAFVDRNDHYQGLIYLDSLAARRLEALITSLDYELHHAHDNYWICRTKSYLIECLLIVDRFMTQSTEFENLSILPTSRVFPYPLAQGVGQEPLISRVLTYLHTHYQETITLDHLSHHFNMNRTTLNAKFKEATATTIAQYLIDFRIHLSKMLLTFTHLQVGEIVERIGFNDLTHFNRSFKQRTGMTPTAYRQNNCKNA